MTAPDPIAGAIEALELAEKALNQLPDAEFVGGPCVTDASLALDTIPAALTALRAHRTALSRVVDEEKEMNDVSHRS